jgi:hypothetical protein
VGVVVVLRGAVVAVDPDLGAVEGRVVDVVVLEAAAPPKVPPAVAEPDLASAAG